MKSSNSLSNETEGGVPMCYCPPPPKPTHRHLIGIECFRCGKELIFPLKAYKEVCIYMPQIRKIGLDMRAEILCPKCLSKLILPSCTSESDKLPNNKYGCQPGYEYTVDEGPFLCCFFRADRRQGYTLQIFSEWQNYSLYNYLSYYLPNLSDMLNDENKNKLSEIMSSLSRSSLNIDLDLPF